ncbi:MAG: hypothetical protein AAFX93_19545 [Verrucomicrobiota bacterium]
MNPADGFSVRATVGGASIDSGIFDGGYAGNNASMFGSESTGPTFTCPIQKLTNGYEEDTEVVILDGPNAGNYLVKDDMPDGTGMITLVLVNDE